MKRFRKNNKIALLKSLIMVNAIALGVSFTAAAFLNIEKHTQSITVNVGYGQYFGSQTQGTVADGTSTNPYIIETPEHLRNLSKLVNIGVFKPSDNFKIASAGFTYDNIPLTPIGTYQNPFVSNLEGIYNIATPESVPIIKNLIVEGDKLPDVGMFGYIGNSGRISNFILENPVIRSFDRANGGFRPANEGFDRNDIDLNPLRDIPDPTDASKKLFGTENCEKISLTSNDANVTKNKVMNSFTLDVSNIETLIANKGFKLYPIISNPKLISQDPKGGPFDFTVNLDATAPINPINKRPADGEYCTVAVAVSGIVPFEGNNHFSTMILERFKLYYQYSKKGILADETDFKSYAKLVFPETYYEDASDEISSEEFTSKYVKHDDIRSLYVGVVAGQIDGSANRIGVKSPTLDIQRPFVSNSVLFGKTIDDTNKRTLSYEEFENNNVLTTDKLTYKYIEPNMIKYTRINKKGETVPVPDPDAGSGNNYVSDIYDLDSNNTKIGFSESAQNIIRIYANRQNNSSTAGGPSNPGGVKLIKDNVNRDGTISIEKAISIQEPINVRLINEAHNIKQQKLGFTQASISNAIQLWVSAQHNRSRVNSWFNGSVEFYLDFEMDYLYFDNANEQTTFTTPSGEFSAINMLKAYAGEKSIRKQRFIKNGKRIYSYHLPRTKPYVASGYPDGVDFEQLSDAINYKQNDKQGLIAYDAYPFAWIESNILADGTAQSGYNNLILKKSDSLAAANSPTNTKSYAPNKMKFSIAANKRFQADFLPSKIESGFFPIFFLGLPDRTPSNPNSNTNYNEYRLDILSMKVMLSNKRGNIDSSTGSVDYISGTVLPLKNPKNNINILNSTGVKVRAKTIDDTGPLSDASSLIQRFAAVSPEAKVTSGNHYIIKVTREKGVKVTVTYNPYNLTHVKSIATNDTPGFRITKPIIDSTLK